MDSTITGFKSLHSACEKGYLCVVKYFIEIHRRDALARNSDICTPLHVASLHGHLRIVQYLVEELKIYPNITGSIKDYPYTVPVRGNN